MIALNTDDNAGIRFLVSARSPHLTADRLAKAVRIEDRRDTLGRKKIERDRSRWSSPSLTLPSPSLVDDGTEARYAAAEAALTACGLSALIPHLREGLTLCESCERAGVALRTANRRLAEIRDNLKV